MPGKYNIFLVDDNEQYLKTLEKHLIDNREIAYNIRTFITGEECLEYLDENPDIIILDYYLDSVKEDAINGIEVLKKIKASKPEVYVVMLSGQEKIDIALETVKHGAFDYVVKNESAHVRTQNIIKNIIKSVDSKRMMKIYKYATVFLSIAFIGIAILTLVLWLAGWVK